MSEYKKYTQHFYIKLDDYFDKLRVYLNPDMRMNAHRDHNNYVVKLTIGSNIIAVASLEYSEVTTSFASSEIAAHKALTRLFDNLVNESVLSIDFED